MNQTNNLSEINRKKVMIRWKKEEENFKLHLDEISNSKQYKILKSRILGFLAGDGGVYVREETKRKKATHHDIAFYPDHPSMIDSFVEAFTCLYLKKPTLRNRGNHYSLKVSSRLAVLDLLRDANFGIHGWEVPLKFLDIEEYKIEWLRAFFDCEGSVGKTQIQLQSVNKKGLLQVKKLLGDLGIESRVYEYDRRNENWSTNYILCIMKKDSRRQYLNRVGFNHFVKLEKLRKQFASVR